MAKRGGEARSVALSERGGGDRTGDNEPANKDHPIEFPPQKETRLKTPRP